MKLKTLQSELGYVFSNTEYLTQALTHKSANKNNYEKLEFLGDSILNYCVSSLIFQKYHNLNEGKLSILRSRLVSKPTLSRIGKVLNLDDHIQTENLKISDSVRADVVEAIIGAIYLDNGIDACHKLISQHFSFVMLDLAPLNLKDSKSHLQELAHQLNISHPSYQIISQEGKSHDITYMISCSIDGFSTEAASGTKRHAEQLAAEKMLTLLKENCHE